ncbi:SCP2 sterol-binding domain-containing protein [Streptomyces sp. SPB162]|uniref:SCP2 sterol-binding domain-containing protein n=1 Tax=Streptomyces sp. SPB162 TaxID=2940560 RepID=UPI0024072B69|nr:SCP2 sterol-binding domain-containing protein [Streptomyces sp. SPB162]MDF9817160.1 putative sterol carrier protein [Streptomyces sp. SPB162]
MALDVSAFERLKAVAGERKGEGLARFAEEHDGGPQGLLDEVFANMAEVFRPDKAKGQQADFQYCIRSGEDEYHYFISVDDGQCRTGRGTVESPRVTMRVKLPDFVRLVTGKLNSMQAFLTGKVKISGDTFYATKFEAWFERP